MFTDNQITYTDRELEVIKLMLMCWIVREIAFDLDIADDTVYSHIKHLQMKTGSHGRANLNVYLLSHGFSVNSEGTEVKYNGKVL